MSDYVRVKDPGTGHEFTVRAGSVPDGAEVLDKPALGRDGLPRPPKYRVPLGSRRAPSSQMDAPKPVAKKTAAVAAPTQPAVSAENKEN